MLPGIQSRRAGWIAIPMAAMLAAVTIVSFSYNHEQDDVNGPVPAKWCNGNFNTGAPCQSQVSWGFGPPPGSNIDVTGGPGYQQAIEASFTSWEQASVNNQLLVNINIQGPVTISNPPSTPDADDCQNVIGFTDTTKSDFSTGTIALTQILTSFGCTVAGANCPPQTPPNSYQCTGSSNPSTIYTCPLTSCIVDADIVFNPADNFSTAATTPANDFDLQAIATHEIGHLLGMDHSGLANAIMFAFGDSGGVPTRTLSEDDAIGLGALYPSNAFSTATGTISGTVKLSGAGIFASHVLVIDAASGNAITDGLTNTDGSYSIFVPPGQYNVLAVPLGGIYDLTEFGGWACGYQEDGPPCCDPSGPMCTKPALSPPTNYSGKFN